MGEQIITKKKTSKLLILLVIILLAALCVLGYLIISGTLPSRNAKTPKEYTAKIGEFVVNLSDKSPTYIKTTITLGYDNKKGGSTISKKLPQIKDCINKYMLSKTSKDFQSETIEGSGDQLMLKINETIGIDLVKDIYFEQIIIQ